MHTGLYIEFKDEKKVFAISPLVKRTYKEPDNPNFEVFYLDEATAYISEIGNPQKVYNLKI